MAPYSRSKRDRNTNPLDLSRILKDDEQQKRFLNHYIERSGLHVFVEDKTPFYIKLIRVFYYNLKLENETLYSYVKGKHIALTLTEFGECFSLPSTGAMLGSFIECPWSGLNKRDFYFSLCRFFEAEISRKQSRSAIGSSRETLGVGNLTVENRLLHYFLEILQKFNVDITIELETPFSIKEHRIDLTSLGKMQIVEAPDGSLRHKDHKVEDDAPLEAPAQPVPPAPQNLGNSPYYQSIMDELAGQRAELVNMRAYMTTRMDHIDSRMDSMDSRFDEITSLLRNL
ncbi:hypothetical protein Lal_00002012 [Lupinus albus]|nr:hypothetical protein Lal_00002012 [Lupinus albus]